MKISFDFDGTLSKYTIKEIAKTFIEAGHDVWVITARDDSRNHNVDLYGVCKYVGIPEDKIIFTNGDYKVDEYINGDFELHYDNDWEEVSKINNVGGTAILVDPDFEDIYMKMQYNENCQNHKIDE